jgi:hypothetical protein
MPLFVGWCRRFMLLPFPTSTSELVEQAAPKPSANDCGDAGAEEERYHQHHAVDFVLEWKEREGNEIESSEASGKS